MKRIQILIAVAIISISVGYISYSSLNYSRGSGTKPTIILITIESTRADRLPCYGHHRNTSPNICKLREDGVLFKKAYSQGTDTTMSIPSLMTSMLPSSVGLKNWEYSLPDEAETLAEVLKKHNYSTTFRGGIGANMMQGFDKEEKKNIDNIAREGEFFWWFIRDQAHFPYAPEDRFRKWDNVSLKYDELANFSGLESQQQKLLQEVSLDEMKKLYDEEILMADHRIGEFIDELKRENLYRNSMIIVTADHGEFLGEHNRFDHGGPPFEEVIHVPLIIKFPDNKWAGKTVAKNVGHIDIVPTIYNYIGIEGSENVFGSPLTNLIGSDKRKRKMMAADEPHRLWALTEGDYKYIIQNTNEVCLEKESPDETLFDLKDDPNEETPLVDEKPEKAEELRKKLCKTYRKGLEVQYERKRADLSQETEERLKNLGYLK